MARPKKSKRKLKSSYIAQQWGFFKRMLQEAVIRKMIPFHPALHLKANGTRRRKCSARPIEDKDTLTEDELCRVLEMALEILSFRIYVLLCLMALAGLRFGEARALQLPDLELDHVHPTEGSQPRLHIRRTERLGILGPPKHGRSRYVRVGSVLEAILRTWIAQLPAGTLWLFPSKPPRAGSKRRAAFDAGHHDPNGQWCIAEETVRGRWDKLMRAVPLGRRLSPKSLRHAFCTIALSQGESLEWVSREMGHRDGIVTQTVYGYWATPPGLGTFARWITTQDIPLRSLLGQPEALGILQAFGVPTTDIECLHSSAAPDPVTPQTPSAGVSGQSPEVSSLLF